MVVETALLIGGLIATFTIGAPLAAMAARSHTWRNPASGAEASRERFQHVAGFDPLVLAPYPVTWPSERPWGEGRIAKAEWPSQAWDDEHFGSHWRDGRSVEFDDYGFHAMAGRRFDESIDEADALQHIEATKQRRLEAGRQRAERAPSTPRSRPKPSAKARPSTVTPAMATRARSADLGDEQRRAVQLRERQLGTSSDSARSRQQNVAMDQLRQAQQERRTVAEAPTPKRSARRAAPPKPEPQLAGPSRDELEALIAKVGLAGTVQAIMDRTGWDFRQAAHYLAKIRQGG